MHANVDEDRASASACWQGRTVFCTMVLLLMLSAFQLGIGITISRRFGMSVLLMITAMLGFFVSAGYIVGCFRGDGEHLLTQVRLVRTRSCH